MTAASNMNATSNSTNGCSLLGENGRHTLFQLSQMFLTIGQVMPTSWFYHTLLQRIAFLSASIVCCVWSYLIACSLDTLIWNAIFTVCHTFYLVKSGKDSIPDVIPKDLNPLYRKTYKPLGIQRRRFRKFLKCGAVRNLSSGEIYSTEGETKMGEKVAVLLEGKIRVTCEDVHLHSINCFEFLDSIEFDDAFRDPDCRSLYQVTITADERSKILELEFRKLLDVLKSDEFLSKVFHCLIGKDITTKMYSIQETLLKRPENVDALARRDTLLYVGTKLPWPDEEQQKMSDQQQTQPQVPSIVSFLPVLMNQANAVSMSSVSSSPIPGQIQVIPPTPVAQPNVSSPFLTPAPSVGGSNVFLDVIAGGSRRSSACSVVQLPLVQSAVPSLTIPTCFSRRPSFETTV